jgi:hypothetical protein
MIQRLTGTHDDNFRSAMAECMACWFLGGKLRLKVSPRPGGAPGKIPDLRIERDEGPITVEVKAPHDDPLPWDYSGSIGDDSEMMASALDEANKQFAHGTANVLFLTPTPKYFGMLRRGLLRAFLGKTQIVVPLELDPTTRPAPSYTAFSQDGRFLRRWGGKPRFTRVSAVVCVSEGYWDPQAYRALGDTPVFPQTICVEHEWYVVHNPHCPCPVPQDIWGPCPQLVRVGDAMLWTDNEPIL